MPTFCHVSDDGDCWLLHFHVHQMRVAAGAGAVVLNTFHDMEKDVVDALKPLLPPVYTVGPLASVLASLPSSPSSPAASGSGGMVSLLKEDGECAAWLEGRAARSVVYVSFGSHASMGGARLREIAAGMARCGSPYLWVLRPEMAAEVAGVRGEDELVVPWCAQEAVLRHPAVGLFVTTAQKPDVSAAAEPIQGPRLAQLLWDAFKGTYLHVKSTPPSALFTSAGPTRSKAFLPGACLGKVAL